VPAILGRHRELEERGCVRRDDDGPGRRAATHYDSRVNTGSREVRPDDGNRVTTATSAIWGLSDERTGTLDQRGDNAALVLRALAWVNWVAAVW